MRVLVRRLTWEHTHTHVPRSRGTDVAETAARDEADGDVLAARMHAMDTLLDAVGGEDAGAGPAAAIAAPGLPTDAGAGGRDNSVDALLARDVATTSGLQPRVAPSPSTSKLLLALLGATAGMTVEPAFSGVRPPRRVRRRWT